MNEKSRILAEIQASRLALTRDTQALADELNFLKKLELTVRKRPLAWLGGAALSGFVFSALRRRPAPKPNPKKSKETPPPSSPARFTFWAFLLAVFKLLLPALRPLFTTYATKSIAGLAGSLGRK